MNEKDRDRKTNRHTETGRQIDRQRQEDKKTYRDKDRRTEKVQNRIVCKLEYFIGREGKTQKSKKNQNEAVYKIKTVKEN